MANPAFPWPVWTAAWLWSMPGARVSHWGTQRGAAGLGGGFSTARAARRQQSSPERGAWAPRVRQGLWHLAQRGLEGLGVLTQGLGQPELQRSDVGGESGGEALRCAHDQVVAGSLWACWCVEEVRAGTAKV